MGTALGSSQQNEEFRSENIDVELHLVEWPFEVVVEGRPYDADRYREHFASAYRNERGAEFHEYERVVAPGSCDSLLVAHANLLAALFGKDASYATSRDSCPRRRWILDALRAHGRVRR